MRNLEPKPRQSQEPALEESATLRLPNAEFPGTTEQPQDTTADAAEIVPVSSKSRALQHAIRQLTTPDAQAVLREKFSGSWKRIEIDRGRASVQISQGVLTIKVNQEKEIAQLLMPSQSALHRDFLDVAKELISRATTHGFRVPIPKEMLPRLSEVLRRFQDGGKSDRALLDDAAKFVSRVIDRSPAADSLFQQPPLLRVNFILSQCDDGKVSSDVQGGLRNLVQALSRSLPPRYWEEAVQQSVKRAKALFSSAPTLSLSEIIAQIPERWETLRQLADLSLLTNTKWLAVLQPVLLQCWVDHKAHFFGAVEHEFLAAISTNDTTRARDTIAVLKEGALPPLPVGTAEYMRQLEFPGEPEAARRPDPTSLVFEQLNLFLDAHCNLREIPASESEALTAVASLAGPVLEWIQRPSAFSDPIPDAIHDCAVNIAKLAWVGGGPEEDLFVQITDDILAANTSLAKEYLPTQIYCILASYRDHYALTQKHAAQLNRRTEHREEDATQDKAVLGYSAFGALDVWATTSVHEIRAHLNSGQLHLAIPMLQTLDRFAELLPAAAQPVLIARISEYADECHSTLKSYWGEMIQPHIQAAGGFLQLRKIARQRGAPLSDDERDCISNFASRVTEVSNAFTLLRDPAYSTPSPRLTELHKLLVNFRNGYTFMVGEWRSCPEAHKLLENL